MRSGVLERWRLVWLHSRLRNHFVAARLVEWST